MIGVETVRRLAIVALAGVATVTPAAAALPSAPFPLGKGNLPEVRSSQQIAPGLAVYTVQRGASLSSDWRVTAGVARTPRERARAVRCLAGLGLSPALESYRAPGSRPRAYVEVAGGRFASEDAAVSAATRAKSCALQAQAVAASPHQRLGPWRLHILEIKPAEFHGRLLSVLGDDTVHGREKPSEIARRTAALAVVNGGFFVIKAADGVEGEPAGLSVIDGQVRSEPTAGRPYLLLSDDGRVGARIVTAPLRSLAVRWSDGGATKLGGVDRQPGQVRNCGVAGDGPGRRPVQDETCVLPDDIVAITPDAGFAPDLRGATTVLVTRDGRLTPARPPGAGEVLLVGIGKGASELAARMASNSRASVDLSLAALSGLQAPHAYAVNGGPLLLKGGERVRDDDREGWSMTEVSRQRANFVHDWTVLRNPRTAVGVGVDGTIWFLVVEGREFQEASQTQAASVGLSIEELRSVMAHLGARDAMNLDGGGSSVLVLNGTLATKPSDLTGERPVGDAIVVMP
jgi:hypothetical protein